MIWPRWEVVSLTFDTSCRTANLIPTLILYRLSSNAWCSSDKVHRKTRPCGDAWARVLSHPLSRSAASLSMPRKGRGVTAAEAITAAATPRATLGPVAVRGGREGGREPSGEIFSCRDGWCLFFFFSLAMCVRDFSFSLPYVTSLWSAAPFVAFYA